MLKKIFIIWTTLAVSSAAPQFGAQTFASNNLGGNFGNNNFGGNFGNGNLGGDFGNNNFGNNNLGGGFGNTNLGGDFGNNDLGRGLGSIINNNNNFGGGLLGANGFQNGLGNPFGGTTGLGTTGLGGAGNLGTGLQTGLTGFGQTTAFGGATSSVQEQFPQNSPRYRYRYAVNDPQTGDQKSHQETRDGDRVTGSYSLVEPGGTVRRVDYTADPRNGFNAVVSRSGHARHPPIQHHHHVKTVLPVALQTFN